MIRKYILGLFILFIGLFFSSFVDAFGVSSVVGLDSFDSLNPSYKVTPLKGGAFLSNYLGIGKSVLAFDNSRLFWWTSNGYPYAYLKSDYGIHEGFFDRYYNCALMTGAGEPTDCAYTMINYSNTGNTSDFDRQVFKSFFTTVVQGNYIYVASDNTRYVGATWSYMYNYMKVCWNSEELGRSFCFKGGYCSYDGPSVCNSFGSLVNSQDLNSQYNANFSFGSLSNSMVSYAPGQAGYGGGGNIEGGSNTSENVSISGNLVYNPCTNGYVINKIRQTYGSSIDMVCYAGSTNTGLVTSDNDPGSGVPNMGFNFKEIYQLTNDGMSWSNWFNGYADEMLRWKQGRVGVNPFIGRPIALYNYFSLLFDHGFIYQGQVDGPDGMGPYFILNYCKLGYSDLNAPYEGSYFKTYCSSLNGGGNSGGGNYNTGDIGTVDGDDEVLPPGFDDGGGGGGGGGSVTSSGTIISVDWSGVLSGDTNQNFDGTNFINDFYQKLQANYQKPTDNLIGIIPNYILVFMFALILFRFLSH